MRTGDVSVNGDLSGLSGVVGDLLYNNGTSWVRVARGNPGQYLKVGASPTYVPTWGTAGGIVQVVTGAYTSSVLDGVNQVSMGGSKIANNVGNGPYTLTSFTAASTDNYLYVYFSGMITCSASNKLCVLLSNTDCDASYAIAHWAGTAGSSDPAYFHLWWYGHPGSTSESTFYFRIGAITTTGFNIALNNDGTGNDWDLGGLANPRIIIQEIAV